MLQAPFRTEKFLQCRRRTEAPMKTELTNSFEKEGIIIEVVLDKRKGALIVVVCPLNENIKCSLSSLSADSRMSQIIEDVHPRRGLPK